MPTERENWVEIRLTGQPPGRYPPYDFVFRSDRDHWRALAGLARAAYQDWANPQLTHRFVLRETTTSDWAPIDVNSLEGDERLLAEAERRVARDSGNRHTLEEVEKQMSIIPRTESTRFDSEEQEVAYHGAVASLVVERPGWRAGQVRFEALNRVAPKLAHEIVGTDLDPFYDDDRIDAFLAWLGHDGA